MTDAPPSFPQATATVTPLAPIRHWDTEWGEFRQKHAQWRMFGIAEFPLYLLPHAATDSLKRATGKKTPLLSKVDAKAEEDFTTICEKHHVVGCWLEQPIRYPYLTVPPPLPAPEHLQQAPGWTPADLAITKRLIQNAQEPPVRLKGYVGWLLTEPGFRKQLEELCERWQALPSEHRPLFPLGRIGRFPLSASAGTLSSEAQAFHQDLHHLLDRWGLIQLSSWDLPDPQGPLLPNLLPPGSTALPKHGIHLVLPLHYPLQGDDNLTQQVLNFQRQEARQLALGESLAGLPHFQAYASLFDVLHLERVIRSRLTGARPAGFVTAMEQAIASALKCSLSSVQKSRKSISACLRGQRTRVAWLRPRAR
jgi:hypothetical protein